MYQQLINLELKTDSNGAIRGYGKALIDNMQNKLQIPLIEDLYPCFMCNLCNNILSINIFVSDQQEQQLPLMNLISVPSFETQEIYVVQEISCIQQPMAVDDEREFESSEEEIESEGEETDEESCEDKVDDIDHDSKLSGSPETTDCLTNHSLEPESTEISNKTFQFSCDTCGRSYKTRFARYHHYKKRECSRPLERKRPPYTCKLCNKTLTTRRGYLLHIKNESGHTKQKQSPFQCSECHKFFKTKIGLKTHRFLHVNDEERPFQCGICKKGFASKLSFQIHAAVHTNKMKKWPCTVCDSFFDGKDALKSHILTHAKELGEEAQNCECREGRALSENPNIQTNKKQKIEEIF